VSLNGLAEEARKKGIEPGSPESRILGARIVDALGEAYARMIFGAGFVHGAPRRPGHAFGRSPGRPGRRITPFDATSSGNDRNFVSRP